MLRTNLPFFSFAENLYQSGRIRLKRFSKGEVLLLQGNKPTKGYIMKEGISKCYYSTENGKSYILEFLSVGEIIGEIELLKKTDCLCTVEAVTHVEAYELPFPLINSLIAEDFTFNRMLIDELADRIINTSSRSSSRQLYTVEHALKNLLSLQAKHNVSLTKENMADYLGITLRSLNRLLKQGR